MDVIRRHLDDHAVDNSRQPRDLVLAVDQVRRLRRREHRARPGVRAVGEGRRQTRARRQARRRRDARRESGVVEARQRFRSSGCCAHPFVIGDPSPRGGGAGEGGRADEPTSDRPTPSPPTPPRKGEGAYAFDVPLLAGDHVTDDAGTGFVHTAPGHGADDFNIWVEEFRPRRHPVHRRRRRSLHQGSAGLRRARNPPARGQESRQGRPRQQSGDGCADRGGRAAGAWGSRGRYGERSPSHRCAGRCL